MNSLVGYKLPSGRSLGLKVVHPDGRPEFWLLSRTMDMRGLGTMAVP